MVRLGADEALDFTQYEVTHIRSPTQGCSFYSGFDTLQAELLSPALGLHHTPRNQRQCRTWLHGNEPCLSRTQRKQPQRKTGRPEFRHAGVVPNQRGSMSGIEVADHPQVLVVTARERWTRVNAARRLHDGAVQTQTKLRHRIALVSFFGGKQFCPAFPEYRLGGIQDVLVLVAPAGYIQKAEQDP